MEFCHEALYISSAPHVACLTTENTSSWALYVLPELWNPRRAKRDLAAVRSHMHVSDRALISAAKRLESWKPTAYAMSFINFSNIEWCHFFSGSFSLLLPFIGNIENIDDHVKFIMLNYTQFELFLIICIRYIYKKYI